MDSATCEATRTALIPSRPIEILTMSEGTIPIARVIARRFQGVVFHSATINQRSSQLGETRRTDEAFRDDLTGKGDGEGRSGSRGKESDRKHDCKAWEHG